MDYPSLYFFLNTIIIIYYNIVRELKYHKYIGGNKMERLYNNTGLYTYSKNQYFFGSLISDSPVKGFTKAVKVTAELGYNLLDTQEYFSVPENDIVPCSLTEYTKAKINNNNIPIVIMQFFNNKTKQHELYIETIGRNDENAITLEIFKDTLFNMAKRNDNEVIIHMDRKYIEDWHFFKFLMEPCFRQYGFKFPRKFKFDEVNKSVVVESLSMCGVC
jgi:hypothetical protein